MARQRSGPSRSSTRCAKDVLPDPVPPATPTRMDMGADYNLAMSVLRALGYFFQEALTSLWRSRLINALSIGTIAVSLFVLGAFLTVASNLNEVVTRWTQKVQVTFYLADGLEDRIRDSLFDRLREDPAVESVVLVSRAQALDRFRGLFRDLRTLPDDLGANPFPASLEVSLRADAPVPGRGAAPRPRLREGARASRRCSTTCSGSSGSPPPCAWCAGWARSWAGSWSWPGVFTISNVIRLTVYARQDELDIMRLVGATRAYVTRALRGGGHDPGRPRRAALAGPSLAGLPRGRARRPGRVGPDGTRRGVPARPSVCLAIVAGGMLVGVVGSLISLGRDQV